MADDTELDRLAAGKYLLITSYRKDGSGVPTPVWMVRDGVVRKDGTWLPYDQCPTPGGCRTGTVFEEYHSADQFWPMQGLESALLLACAAAAVAATYAVLRRRAF